MGMEFVKLKFDRRKWKGEIHIPLSKVGLMAAVWETGKMKQDGLQSAVFWPDSADLEEEFSDYRSWQQKMRE